MDYLAQPDKEIYHYRLVAIDSCDGIDTISNIANNINVDVLPKENEQNHVFWNSYTHFAEGVRHYQVYRTEDENEHPNLIADERTDTLYIDDIRSFNEKTYCYQVRAIENLNPLDIPQEFQPFTSISNLACAQQETKILLPNAFNPNSTNPTNRTWGVQGRRIDPNNFQLMITDRWGKVIFQTENPEEEWDGKINGNEAQMGVYTYLLRWEGKEERGTVMLVR